MDAVLRQQQQFVDEQRLQNKQIELKKAELQELNEEISRQKNEIQKRKKEAANSAKNLHKVPEVQPEPSSATSKPSSRLPSLSSQQRKKKRQHYFYEKCSSPKIPFTASLSNQQEFFVQHQQLPTPQQQVPLDSSPMHTTHSQPRCSYPNVDLYLGTAQQPNFSRSDWKMQIMHLYYQDKLRESSVREFEQMLNRFN